jgi:hypothetical protein
LVGPATLAGVLAFSLLTVADGDLTDPGWFRNHLMFFSIPCIVIV